MRRAIEAIIFTACLLAALVLPEQAYLAAAGAPHAVLPKGTVLTLKLQEEISSDTAQSGDEVKALLLGEVADSRFENTRRGGDYSRPWLRCLRTLWHAHGRGSCHPRTERRCHPARRGEKPEGR